jgi:hypothetical protein
MDVSEIAALHVLSSEQGVQPPVEPEPDDCPDSLIWFCWIVCTLVIIGLVTTAVYLS